MVIVLEDLGTQFRPNYTKRKFRKWKVQCPECNKVYEIFGSPNRVSRCKECGDKQGGKKRELHGLHRHRLMAVWSSMKQRCYNPNHRQYKDYGGKSVTICNEWLNSFQSFYDWSIANGYQDNYQIDKDIICQQLAIEPKVYSPQTCKWVSRFDNAGITSRRKLSNEQYLEIHRKYADGITRAELAREYKCSWNNIKHILLHFRLENNELKRI